MASLYDLTGDYARFSELMEMEELTPEQAEMLKDALDNMVVDIEDKLENYAKIIKNFESDIEGLKAEETRLASKRKTLENNIKNMKARMTDAMIATGKTKIKGSLFSFNMQKNTPSVVIDEAYIENIPSEYLIAQEPKIDKKKLSDDLKAGKDLDGVAHLEQTQTIRIR